MLGDTLSPWPCFLCQPWGESAQLTVLPPPQHAQPCSAHRPGTRSTRSLPVRQRGPPRRRTKASVQDESGLPLECTQLEGLGTSASSHERVPKGLTWGAKAVGNQKYRQLSKELVFKASGFGLLGMRKGKTGGTAPSSGAGCFSPYWAPYVSAVLLAQSSTCKT